MKTVLLILSCFYSLSPFAQDKLNEQVRSKRFVFIATSMSSVSGGLKMFNTPYDVSVKSDSLIVVLPYMGIANSARPDETNLNFISNKLSYTIKESRKGFQVDIAVADEDARMFSFFILKNGTATLDVINSRREPVSYRGYIKKL